MRVFKTFHEEQTILIVTKSLSCTCTMSISFHISDDFPPTRKETRNQHIVFRKASELSNMGLTILVVGGKTCVSEMQGVDVAGQCLCLFCLQEL